MNSFSMVHWLIMLIIFAPWIWAIARILQRIGYSGWWVIIAFIPVGNIVGAIVLASMRWPVERAKAPAAA